MNKKIIGAITTFILIFFLNFCYAESKLDVSPQSVTVGETFKVTASVSKVGAWQMYVNVTGPAQLMSGTTSDPDGSTQDGMNGAKSIVSKYKVTGIGDITVSFTGNATDENVNKEIININKVVVGKEKVDTPTSKPKVNTTSTNKSSNAKIKALTVNVEGLNPSFNKDKTNYKLEVGTDVSKLNMTISLDDNKATYRITGNKDFKDGENIVKIIVTAENKTTKTYKITVTKTTDLRLNTLVLANATLINEFDSDVYEYNLRDIESNINKLDINAIPINSNAIVKIAGNDSLTIGENIIKIVVYDKDEKASKVYTLKVNKLEEAIEAISDDAKIIEQNSYAEMLKDKIEIYKDKFGVYGNAIKLNATIILLYLLALIEFAQVIYLYKQLKNIDPSFDKIKIKKKETESKRIKRRKVNIDIDIDDKE